MRVEFEEDSKWPNFWFVYLQTWNFIIIIIIIIIIIKSNVHRRTGHEGPEWEYRYYCTLSLNSALDWVGWSTPRPGRFTPGKDPVPIV